MSFLSDSHVHSDFSSDGKAPLEIIVLAAIQKGMKIITFTEHNDFDYPHLPGEPVEFLLNVDSYLYELLCMREKYGDQISIRFGIELGLDTPILEKNRVLSNAHEFDFIIGSSHVVHGQDPYYKEYFEGRSEKEAYREYFESIFENITSFDNFDVYGHLDYVLRYGPTQNKNFSYSEYSDLFDAILKHLIEHGKGIEVNSGGYRHGIGCPNPCYDIVKRYHELGGEIITIGSDAHEPSYLQDHFDNLVDMLKNIGFKYHAVYERRRPEFFNL